MFILLHLSWAIKTNNLPIQKAVVIYLLCLCLSGSIVNRQVYMHTYICVRAHVCVYEEGWRPEIDFNCVL